MTVTQSSTPTILLAFTAVLGVALRSHAELHAKVVNSAFAEFPVVGSQIHDQLGVEAFTGTVPSLMIGIAGALIGGRGFAHALQKTLKCVGGARGRPAGVLSPLLADLRSAVAVGTHRRRHRCCQYRSGTAASLGYGGFPARVVSIAVATVLGFGFFLIFFRVVASGQVSTRSMMLGGAISALGSQILLTVARIVVAHQLRHAQAVAGLLGVVLWLLAWLALQATVIVDAINADVVRGRHFWPRSIVQPLPIVAAAGRRAC